MRYVKVGSDEYLENGGSTVRVGRVLAYPSPLSPGRIVRVFEILEHTRINPNNPVPRGALLALSFPGDQVNASEFIWRNGEECQVPYEIKERKVNLDAAAQRKN